MICVAWYSEIALTVVGDSVRSLATLSIFLGWIWIVSLNPGRFSLPNVSLSTSPFTFRAACSKSNPTFEVSKNQSKRQISTKEFRSSVRIQISIYYVQLFFTFEPYNSFNSFIIPRRVLNRTFAAILNFYSGERLESIWHRKPEKIICQRKKQVVNILLLFYILNFRVNFLKIFSQL